MPAPQAYPSAPIVVMGGVGGIGEALVRRLRADGASVLLSSRNLLKAQVLANDVGASPFACDVLDEDALNIALADVLEQCDGRIGGLVYAIGSINLKSIDAITAKDMATTYALNVIGAALACKALARGLKAAAGSVVLFSSVAAAQGFPNHATISPAKAAVEGLSRTLAAEWAPHVRVNTIAPSLSVTPLSRALVVNEKMAEAIAALHPLKRLGQPDDSAQLAAFLLSDAAQWITGQTFGVDGGRGTLRVGKS